ncbi:MAG: queuosine precursor transporter, partial [Bdellovibrionales bacterium]
MTKRKDGELRVTGHDYEWSPKYYAVISGLFIALYLTTTALGNKIFTLYGISTTAGLLTFPLCTVLSDILTETYGFNRTRQVIWTAMATVILFTAFTYIAIELPPAPFWPHQEAFAATFATTWRLAAGGCAAWAVGELLNSFIMSRLKIFQQATHMPVRFIGSTVVAQFFDTLTVGLIAF